MPLDGYAEAIVIVDVFVDHLGSIVKKKSIYMGIIPRSLAVDRPL
jgi:hypothetical protein